VFAVAVALYLPTARHGFVQDDWAIVALNPAAHSPAAALRAADDSYWPPPAEAGLWRPLTILSFAVDWTVSDGRVGWLHVANALWHGLASALVCVLLARWLPRRGAVAAGLVFAVHPVHVEAVAGLVGRAELLVAVALLGAVLAARNRRWVGALVLAAAAMLAKESGAVVGLVILAYCWLDREVAPPPRWFVAGLISLTLGYLLAWWAIGGAGASDVAAPFIGATMRDRLPLALSAVWRAGLLLLWPARLSVDYGPQVIPVPSGVMAAALGLALTGIVITTVWWSRRRAPQLAWAGAAAALAYVPASNLIVASGVVLAERNLYVAVVLPAALAAIAIARTERLAGRHTALALTAVVVGAFAIRSGERLPDWRSNRTHLLGLLTDHPESVRGQVWAAAVLVGMGDTAAARDRYARAIALYDRDPHVLGSAALFHLAQGDSAAAADLARRARRILPREREALRVQYLLARAAGDTARANALSDSIGRWYRRGRELYAPSSQ